MQVEIDLVADFVTQAKKDLANKGIEIDPGMDDDEIAAHYFDLFRRWPEKKPRTISKAKSFACPPKHAQGLKMLESKFTKGDDVRPNLSKNLKDLNYNDAMLNSWGLLHFHLGTELMPNELMKRTGPLLYARVDDEVVYFLGVFSHGEWSKKELLDIIEENWPETLTSSVAKGATKLSWVPTEEERQQLRNNKINILDSTKNGQILVPLGMGMATDGSSVQANMNWLRFKKDLSNVNDLYRNHEEWPPELKAEVKLDGKIRFRLKDWRGGILRVRQEGNPGQEFTFKLKKHPTNE